MAAGVFVALRWGAACGHSFGENNDPTPQGNACGVVKAQFQWALIFLPAVTLPAARRGPTAFRSASVLVGLLLVVINSAVAPTR